MALHGDGRSYVTRDRTHCLRRNVFGDNRRVAKGRPFSSWKRRMSGAGKASKESATTPSWGELNTSPSARRRPAWTNELSRAREHWRRSDDTNVAVTEEAHGAEARRDWLAAQRENRCVSVSGDSLPRRRRTVPRSPMPRKKTKFNSSTASSRRLGRQPARRTVQQCGRYACSVLRTRPRPRTAAGRPG